MTKKILIVKRDQDISLALSIRLQSKGYQPLLAYDAMMGISMAFRDWPDLIILDLTMPGGIGLAVAERIRASTIQKIAEAPIIFLTEARIQECKEKALAYHPIEFFEKPYDAEILLSTIDRVLT